MLFCLFIVLMVFLFLFQKDILTLLMALPGQGYSVMENILFIHLLHNYGVWKIVLDSKCRTSGWVHCYNRMGCTMCLLSQNRTLIQNYFMPVHLILGTSNLTPRSTCHSRREWQRRAQWLLVCVALFHYQLCSHAGDGTALIIYFTWTWKMRSLHQIMFPRQNCELFLQNILFYVAAECLLSNWWASRCVVYQRCEKYTVTHFLFTGSLFLLHCKGRSINFLLYLLWYWAAAAVAVYSCGGWRAHWSRCWRGVFLALIGKNKPLGHSSDTLLYLSHEKDTTHFTPFRWCLSAHTRAGACTRTNTCARKRTLHTFDACERANVCNWCASCAHTLVSKK